MFQRTTDSIAKAEDDLGVVPLGPTEDHLTKQDESQLCTNTSLTNVDLQMVSSNLSVNIHFFLIPVYLILLAIFMKFHNFNEKRTNLI